MKLSKNQVQKFLHEQVGEEVRKVSPVGQGEWSQTFFYQEKTVDKVIRFADIDEDFRNDQFAATNYGSAGLPIPKIEKIGRAFGGYFAISLKAEGEMIDDLGAIGMQRVLPALIKLFAVLRTADTSKTIGYGAWDRDGNGASSSWKNYILRVGTDFPDSRTHGWKKKLARKAQANDVFNQAYQILKSSIKACPEERHLIHSDLLHFNLLVNDSKISAVIDWGCAKYGDFLYDVAWFIFWQFYYPSMANIDFEGEIKKYLSTAGVDIPHIKERIKCYQLHIGLDSMAYCAFKENQKDMNLVMKRLLKVMG